MKNIVFSILLFCAQNSSAALFAELSGISLTDASSTTVESSYSKLYYSLDIYANLDTKKTLFAGFHYDQISFTDQATAASTYGLTSQDMGLMGMWIMDKAGTYSLTLGYNLIQTGSLTATGATAADLSGSAYWGSLGIMPQLGNSFYAGIKLLYYQANYNKKTVGSTFTDVSYSRTFMLPVFSMSFRY